ncbi:hypothetical protein I309_03254 [Cryptococcus deuterogattii LA55]|nr:hypothetical protein I309_03254 [Cryptococcus deuterogattii LA55]KIR90565.1 hypothetical protein I304_05707 [Cryptococcus deuterogattii CBS 10090]
MSDSSTWIDHTNSLPFEETDHLSPQSPRSSHPSTTTLATDELFGSYHLPAPASRLHTPPLLSRMTTSWLLLKIGR